MDVVGLGAKLLHAAHRFRDSVGGVLSSRELEERLGRISVDTGPYGVDPFGFDPEYLSRLLWFGEWLYRRYFRCEAFGVDNIPSGRCFVVANHSGQLPFDAAMISLAAFLDSEPPRMLRSMVERFVPASPFISTFLARCGQVLGTPDNCRHLLDSESGILVFPEGVRGLNKVWSRRYELQRFGQGFVRLALEMDAPIVPTVVIGAEEQAPALLNPEGLAKACGLPAFPITPTHPLFPIVGLLPLPTRYRIYFGKPMTFAGNANDEDRVIVTKVEQVRSEMQRMINDGLKRREHVFW